MAEKFSTGLRNWLLGGRSLREAFDDFVIKIFSGTAPTDADAAESGTLLCVITKNSQQVDATERSVAKQAHINITSASNGQTIIVAVNGVDYTYTVVSEDTNLRAVALKVARMLDDIPEIRAIANATGTSDGSIAIKSAIAGREFTIAKGGGGGGGTATWTLTDNTVSNSRSDALQWDAPSNAQMNKPSEVWSGVNLASGIASYFRIVRPNDTGAASTTARRIQGSCGTGAGVEMIMTNVSLTIGATTTIDSGTISIPVG